MPVERGDTHTGDAGQLLDPDRLRIVAANPADSLCNPRHPAIGAADLPHHRALRTVDEPPEDFTFDRRGQHRNVGGAIQQSQKTDHRIDQIIRDVADSNARRFAPGGWRGPRLQQQSSDRLRPQ